MPVSPELGERLGARLLAHYTEAERDLFERVARRLANGIDEPGWAEKKLLEVGTMRRETAKILDRLRAVGDEQIPSAVEEAYNAGLQEARRDLNRAEGEFIVASNPRLITSLSAEALSNVQASLPGILRRADDIYRSVIARSALGIVSGTATRRDAAQQALNLFADSGITGFVDARGREWDMASYAEMALRTVTGRASIDGHTESLEANGHDLVIVSDAPEECEICRPWEGQVLSLSGGSPDYPSLDEAQAEGLFHPNCRHRLGVYIPGVTRSMGKTADPIGSQERTQQRYLERGVRQWKRREAVAITDTAQTQSSGKVREWQTRLREFVADNDRKRLAYRESIAAR